MQYMGWSAEGIDLSASAVAAGRRAGLKITAGSMDVLESRPQAFDRIIASHAVEHVPDVERCFRAFFTALKPNGTLAIEIPNGTAAALQIYGEHFYYLTLPVHFHLFSPRSLRLMVQRAGFTEIRIRTISNWRMHAESWLVRRDARRGKLSAQFNSYSNWKTVAARVPAWCGFLRSLGGSRGDCLRLVCKRPARS
jgi:2-polyprenyl-3-methyl-5-hydroxy-6-metoxy-1,4-benzoquinol methylase